MRAALRTLGLAIAFFVGILAVTGIVAAFSAEKAVTFALITLGITTVSLKWPMRFLGLGHRGVVGTALVSAVFASAMAYGFVKDEKNDRLAALAEEDPAQFLVELKDHDRGRWLKELERLDPEAHRAEVARMEAEKAARAAKEERDRIADAGREVRERCSSQNAKIHAYVLSQEQVKRRLKAPITADFPSYTKVRVLTSGECSSEIVGYVDAQNAFGAMLRTHYVAKLTRDKHDDNGWRLDMVEIL